MRHNIKGPQVYAQVKTSQLRYAQVESLAEEKGRTEQQQPLSECAISLQLQVCFYCNSHLFDGIIYFNFLKIWMIKILF